MRWILLIMLLAACAHAEGGYVSPYSVRFTVPVELLTADFEQSPRNDVAMQSQQPPYADWYNQAAYGRGQLTWGPRQHTRYPPPVIPPGVNAQDWQRERVIATALRYLGYDYQHHHIPDWCPSDPGWPWKPVAAGHNSKGLDCSNFTGWNYNYGLGILLNTAVKRQAEQTAVTDAAGRPLPIQKLLAGVNDYATLMTTLRTGDMLYIRSNKGEISHVVTWVGSLGVSPDGTPLVIDSHGSAVVDSNGQHIPQGIHLRPFRQGSWYHRSFAHAHRIIQ